MHILAEILLQCYARLERRHWDVTAPLALPQRPYSALAVTLWQPVYAVNSLCSFWACSKLGGDLGDLGDLTAICSAATSLYEISQWPSGDQRWSGWFCRSQRGHHPVWLGYYSSSTLAVWGDSLAWNRQQAISRKNNGSPNNGTYMHHQASVS